MADQLWFDDDHRDFFLVPEEVAVPVGDFYVRTFDGRIQGMDRASLSAYQVDADTARPHVRAWIEGGYERAREAFARGYRQDAPIPPTLEAAIGVDPARLASEPEALIDAAAHVGQRLARWLEHDASPEVARSVRQGSSVLAGILTTLAKAVNEPPPAEE